MPETQKEPKIRGELVVETRGLGSFFRSLPKHGFVEIPKDPNKDVAIPETTCRFTNQDGDTIFISEYIDDEGETNPDKRIIKWTGGAGPIIRDYWM